MNIVRIALAAAGFTLCAAPGAFAQAGLEEQQTGTPVAYASAETTVPIITSSVSAATPRNAFGARSKGECPKENQPQAIDPRKAECFAEFASVPFPSVPDDFMYNDNAEGLAKLAAFRLWREEQGVELVRQLDQPGVCSEDTQVPRYTACALIVARLDPEFRPTGIEKSERPYVGSWTFLIKVYRISHPADPRNATLYTVNSDNSEGFYGPKEQWRAAAVQRAREFCKERGGTHVGTGVSAAGLMPDSCKPTTVRPTFTPVVIVPWTQAREFFANEDAIDFHFNAPPHVVQDVEATLRAMFGD